MWNYLVVETIVFIYLSKKDKNGNEVPFFKRSVRYRHYLIHSGQILLIVLLRFGVAGVRSTNTHSFTRQFSLTNKSTDLCLFISLFFFLQKKKAILMNINLGQRKVFYSTHSTGALFWLNLRNAICLVCIQEVLVKNWYCFGALETKYLRKNSIRQ